MSDYDRQEMLLHKVQESLVANGFHFSPVSGGDQPPFLHSTEVREQDVGIIMRLAFEHYPAAVVVEETGYTPETDERYATADLTIWCKTHEQMFTGMHPGLTGHD